MESTDPSVPRPSRILLADDDELFRGSFSRLLRDEGYDCVGAADGAQALALLRETEFDAFISDIVMPGNVGLELIASLPQIAAGLPVILVTGRPTVETAINAVNLAVAGYLLKPPDWMVLRRLLDQAVGNYRALRKVAASRHKFERWVEALRLIERTMKDPASTDKTIPVAQYLESISANLITCLDDIEQVLDVLARMRNSGAGLRHAQLVSALRRTIDTLEQSKQSFRSKRLARLRSELQLLLRDLPS